MTSRNRKESSGFDLQPGTISHNGKPRDHRTSAPAEKVEPSPPEVESAERKDAAAPGKIEVSPRAIAHIVSRAAQQSYGVVGLAQRHARPGWSELLRREEAHKGVEVSFPEGQVVIDLYVVIEYGTRISEVARNIMSNVKFAVESALAISPVQVNVNVQDIRVSESD
jgi:uncharacterized alkaline shock family protein YloU